MSDFLKTALHATTYINNNLVDFPNGRILMSRKSQDVRIIITSMFGDKLMSYPEKKNWS